MFKELKGRKDKISDFDELKKLDVNYMSPRTTLVFTAFLLSLIFSLIFLVCVAVISVLVTVAKDEIEILDSDLVSIEEDMAIFRLELSKRTVVWPSVLMLAAVTISLRQLFMKAEDELWGYFQGHILKVVWALLAIQGSVAVWFLWSYFTQARQKDGIHLHHLAQNWLTFTNLFLIIACAKQKLRDIHECKAKNYTQEWANFNDIKARYK